MLSLLRKVMRRVSSDIPCHGESFKEAVQDRVVVILDTEVHHLRVRWGCWAVGL